MKLIITALLCVCAFGQQQTYGIKNQAGTADMHLSSSTLPNRTGTGSPVSRDNCATIGESFFQTDATAGSNTWACTATGTPGTWTLQGGSATVPSVTNLLKGNGSGAAADSGVDPANLAGLNTANTFTGSGDYSAASSLRVVIGTGAPSTGCTASGHVGKVYQRSDTAAANASLYVCSKTGASTYAWELVQGAAGGTQPGITAVTCATTTTLNATALQNLNTFAVTLNCSPTYAMTGFTAGQVFYLQETESGGNHTVTAGALTDKGCHDPTDTYTTVQQFQATSATTAVAVTGAKSNNPTSGIYDSACTFRPITRIPTTGAVDPSLCAVGDQFVNTASTPVLKLCTATNVWTTQGGGGSSGPTFSAGQGYLAPFGFVDGGAFATSVASLNPDTNTGMVCTQFVNPYSWSVSKVSIILGTAPGASKAVAYGLMNAAGTMLGQIKAVAPTGSRPLIMTFGSAITLTPGIYNQCVGTEDAATTFSLASLGTAAAFVEGLVESNGAGGVPREFTCSNSTGGTGATYALPSTCGTMNAQYYYPIIASLLLP